MAQNFLGTSGDDVIRGTEVEDHIYGLEGNDVLHGRGHADWIEGGSGNDFITGGEGVDIVEGGTGNDSVFAGADDNKTDVLYGDAGKDILAGGAGADLVLGGTGADTLYGGTGADLLVQFGIPSGLNETLELLINDALAPSGIVLDLPSDITFPALIDLLDTATNGILTDPTVLELLVSNLTNIVHDLVDDAVLGTGKFPQVVNPSDVPNFVALDPNLEDALALIEEDGGVIWSGDGEDISFGDNGNDIIGGGKDGDLLVGLDGDDHIYGATGSDLIYGGLGKDLLFGGAGNDWVSGGGGQDTIFDGAGQDTVGGGLNADILVAGEGDDYMIGTAAGNEGDFDRYVFDRAVKTGHDTIGLVQLKDDAGTPDTKDDTFNITADADFKAFGLGAGNHDTIDLSTFELSSTQDLVFTLVDTDNDAAADSTKISLAGDSDWSVTVIGVMDTDPNHWASIIELEPDNSNLV